MSTAGAIQVGGRCSWSARRDAAAPTLSPPAMPTGRARQRTRPTAKASGQRLHPEGNRPIAIPVLNKTKPIRSDDPRSPEGGASAGLNNTAIPPTVPAATERIVFFGVGRGFLAFDAPRYAPFDRVRGRPGTSQPAQDLHWNDDTMRVR